MQKVLDGIMKGAATPFGKAIALLLTMCLCFMTWNVAAVEYAFANEGDDLGSVEEPLAEEPVADETEEIQADGESEPIAADPVDSTGSDVVADADPVAVVSGDDPVNAEGQDDSGDNSASLVAMATADGEDSDNDSEGQDSKKAITITANSATKTYDSQELYDYGVTVTGVPDGYTVEAAATGSVTDVQYDENGEVVGIENEVKDSFVIRDNTGEDVTKYFVADGAVQTISGTLTVNPAPVTVSTGSATKIYDGEPLTNEEASIAGLVNDETAGIVATGTQTEVGSNANTYEIAWAADGNQFTAKAGNYVVTTENLGTLEVTTSGHDKVTLTAASDEKVYDGTPLANSSVTATGLPEGYTVEATASGEITNVLSVSEEESSSTATIVGVANTVNDGYKILDATGEDVTAEFTDIELVNGTLTILPRDMTVWTGSATKTYDGEPLTNGETDIVGLVNDETVGLKMTGSQTLADVSSNSCEIEWADEGNGYTALEDNYRVNYEFGYLAVTPRPVTLITETAEKEYDGTPLAAHSVLASESTPLAAGDTIAVTDADFPISLTDIGSQFNYVNTSNVRIVHGEGEEAVDATSSYTITYQYGTLTIGQRELDITTGSASKPYDGKPLTNDEVTVKGLAADSPITVTATGTITEVGSKSNVYAIDWGTENQDNYKIVEHLGTLTIEPYSEQVTIAAASASKDYDGKPLADKTVTATGLPEGFRVVATASGSQTEAGASANVVNDGYAIKAHNGEDKTSSFSNIKVENGTLTVNKATLSVITESKTAVYDGTTLVASGRVVGLAEGENVTFAVTGKQKDVGSSINTYTLAFAGEEGADAFATAMRSNYTISEQLGTLVVTDYTGDVVVLTTGGTFPYDGKAHGATVEVLGLNSGYTVEASSNATATDVTDEPVAATCDKLVIKNAEGEDVTSSLSIRKVDGTIEIIPAELTITTGSDSKQYDGAPLTADGTIEGLVEGETVAFAASGSIVDPGTVENGYSLAFAGEAGADETVTAKRSNYKVASANLGTLEVTQHTDEVVLTAATASKTYDGEALTVNKVIPTGLPEGFTTSAIAVGSQTNVGVGENVVADSYIIYDANGRDKTANFTSVRTAKGTLTVAPSELTITTGSATKPYDGTPLTYDYYTVEGLAPNETIGLTVTGSQTEYGMSNNTCELTWNGTAEESNYTVKAVNLGTLTITTNNVPVTLAAASAKKTYDGTPLTANSVVATGLPDGFTVEGTASGSQTNAGIGANVLNDGYVIKNAAGEDKTWNFTNIKKAEGTLIVTQRPITLTSASGNKVYDGTPLVKNAQSDVEVGGDGFVAGEGATYDITGSQTAVGSSLNTFTYSMNANTNANNYDVTTHAGTLTVTQPTGPVVVTITENSGSYMYDGAEHVVSGYTVSTSSQFYGEDDFAFSGNATVKGTDAGTYAMSLKPSDFANTNPDFTDVQFVVVDGTLEIGKRSVKLTSATDNKPYDSTPLVNSTVTVSGDGFASGEGATYSFSGSQTAVGSSENSFTYALNEGTKAGNYNITTEFGTLTVTNRDALYEITVAAKSDSVLYDGGSHAVSGLETTTFTVDGAEYTVSGLNAGGAAATNAGAYTNSITGTPVVTDANGNVVTDQFAVHTQNGKLEIAKRSVVLTSADGKKAYDGTALMAHSVQAGGDGFAAGEGATYSITGSQTLVGSSENSFTYALDEGTDANNYDIQTKAGTLEVTDDSVDDGLVISMNDTRSDGYEYKLGETITYSVTVTNIYDDEKPLAVSAGDMAVLDAPATIAPGETVTFTVTKVVGEDDILAAADSQGQLASSITASVGDLSKVGTDTVKVSDANVSYTIDASASDTSDLSVGDVVAYTVVVANTGNVTLSDIAVGDAMSNGAAIEWASGTELRDGKPIISSLGPGSSVTLHATYEVTQADVDAQRDIVDTISATAKAPNGQQASPVAASTVRMTPAAKNAAVAVTANVTSATPSRGYALGDEIVYEITVTNTGNVTLSDIVVGDELTGADQTIASLAPGASDTLIVRYAVAEKDILNGSVSNVVSVSGADPQGYSVETEGSASSATEAKNSHMTVTSTAANNPTHGSAFTAGETVQFSVTVTNDGNVTVSDIAVVDTLTGSIWTVASLEPGASATFTAPYVVDADDVSAGSVANVVRVSGVGPQGEALNAASSDGSVRTQPLYDLTVQYVYADNPGVPFSAYTESYAAGETYTVTPTAIAGYTPNTGSITASMPSQNVTVQVVYTANAAASGGDGTGGGGADSGAAAGGATGGDAGIEAINAAGAAASLAIGSLSDSIGSLFGGSTVIGDNANPLAEVIEDDANALSSGVDDGAWSPFDLACTVLAALLAILMLAGLLRRERSGDDDEPNGTRNLVLRVLSVVPAVAAVVLFAQTQDMSQPIVLFDSWSIPFALLACVNVALMAALALRGDDSAGNQRFAGADA